MKAPGMRLDDHQPQATHRICRNVEAGPSDGRLTILLHGFPEFWFGWQKQIRYLASRGLHVIVPDQRGYNLSSKPKEVDAYTIDSLIDDVAALIDAYGLIKFGGAHHFA
jgi:epoxide hydrolase 4